MGNAGKMVFAQFTNVRLLQVKNERWSSKKVDSTLGIDSKFFHRAYANPCMM
jgi:hypothetical protein